MRCPAIEAVIAALCGWGNRSKCLGRLRWRALLNFVDLRGLVSGEVVMRFCHVSGFRETSMLVLVYLEMVSCSISCMRGWIGDVLLPGCRNCVVPARFATSRISIGLAL